MKLALTAAFAAVVLTACASAPATEGGAEVASADGDKICRREAAMGSNMPQRVCKTREEWNATSKADQAGVDDFKRTQAEAGTPGIGN